MSTISENGESPKPEKKKKNTGSSKRIKVNPKISIVQDVILLMNEAQVNELHFEQGGVKIHLRKGAGPSFETFKINGVGTASQASETNPTQVSQSPSQMGPTLTPKNESTVTINSPMVGTFYRSSAPEAKPFIEEGDKIEAGQVYCIIEAMKLMNEVKADQAGKVVKILAQNGQAVEFNQPLIVIDPS